MINPSPLDAARDFRINEMFFSTTDRAGRILSGNDVFVRVSGYQRADMIGRAHNLIRHPDMPRAVFRIVWDHLTQGRAVAGLIKNLASDGKYYWVIAYLMPVRGGYLSIRFKPSTDLLRVAEEWYAQIRACEREHEANGAERNAGMEASAALLQRSLRERGFEGYEAFMRTLLHEEMKSRDAVLASRAMRLFPETISAAGRPAHQTLEAIYLQGCRAYGQINALYGQLDEFVRINQQIGAQSARVLEQTADFRFIAFNAALRAARLGHQGHSLGVISEYLGTASSGTTRLVAILAERIQGVTDKLRVVIFSLAAARLQIEMVLSFCAELAATTAAADDADLRRRMIGDLQLAFSDTVARAAEALVDLGRELGGLDAVAEDLRRNVLTLQVAQVGGMVEASRLLDDDSFAVMFTDLRGRVEATKVQLAELGGIGGRLAQLAENTPEITRAIMASARQMEHEIGAMTHLSDAPPSTQPEHTSAKADAADVPAIAAA